MSEKLELYSYQKDAVRFALRRYLNDENSYIATFAGGGKSAIAINAVKMAKAKKVLVLAPKILLRTWELEFKKWNSEPETLKISTYESVHKIAPNEQFDFIICDEAQKLKNPKAQRTKRFVALATRTNANVLYLSATPFDRPIDVYGIIAREVKPKIPWRMYVTKYCAAYKQQFGQKIVWNVKGASNIKELRARLSDFMLVQDEADELELPPLTEEIVVFNGNRKLAKLEKKIANLASVDVAKLIENPRQVLSLEEMAELKHEAGTAKIDQVIKYVEDIQHPFLVFVHHQDIAEAYRAGIENSAIVYGKNTYARNQDHIELFNKGKLNCLILSLTSAVEGLTLTRAKQAIFAELPWQASTVYQAKKRIHRISQEHPVLATFCTIDNSLDYRITQLLKEKSSTLKEFGLSI